MAGGGGRGSTSAAIVLDGSYSMSASSGGVALFEEAKERAREVLGSLDEGDEVVLLVPGGSVSQATDAVRDLDLVRERIDAATPGRSAVEMAVAVREAARALGQARHPNREVHVISDFQRSAWESLEEGETHPEPVGLFLFPVGGEEPPPNSWVESVDFSGQILEKGSPIEFRTVIASGPGFGPREVEVEMEVGGQLVDRRRIDLGPASRVALTFRETFREDGLHLGTITIRSGQGLQDDDRRHFLLRTARGVPVLLVSGNQSATRFLRAALSPEGAEAGTFAIREAPLHELESASREREAVVILADVERFTEAELTGLKSYLSQGGGLLVFPGPRMDAAAWGRSFLPKFLPGSLADLRSDPGAITITRIDSSHPLFDVFREGDGGVTDVRFTRTLQFRPRAGTAVLASYSTGNPAILESSLLPGRVLFFTSSLDPSWSDLPLTGVFLPLVHEAVRYLSETSAKTSQDLDVGEGATIWLPRVPEGGGVTLHSPAGTRRAVALEPGPGGYALRLPDATDPGFWVFESARSETLAAVAVNIPAAESDLTRIPVAEIHDRLEFAGTVLEGEGELSKQVREARVGREIGRWFLWAAACLLLLEMILAARARMPIAEEATP
jgi:hypothetical protein